ncbi:hypothetical protein [Pantoea ananatis]|uniref:hypothetical protein n=1 Tax=Pantoea ananas TaxID=553 RepID=UPI0006961FFE|nr:hypothetical protein [Pantoea ananatis]
MRGTKTGVLTYLISVSEWFGSRFTLINNQNYQALELRLGKKGGEKKTEVYIVIQRKLVDLINELAPQGGWKSKASAVNDLIDPLWEYVEASDFVINNQSKKYRLANASQDALAETILKYLSRNVESVRLAFDSHIHRKNNHLVAEALLFNLTKVY